MFLYHDRMGAAVLLSGGTIVIVIFFVFVAVRFAYHPAAAATADQYAGKQIDFIFLGRCTGVQVANPLHQVKIIPINNGFVSIFHANPLGGRAALHLFQLKVLRTFSTLDQRAGIGFILQNPGDGICRPPAILPVCIAFLGMGKAIILFICQRRERTQPVQLICDGVGAESFQAHPENAPHHLGSIFVYYKKIMVIFGFTIAVNRESSNEIPILTLSFQGTSRLDGNIPCVGFIHNVLY